MKPLLRWAGGKAKLLPKIMERLPKFYKTYHEPFVGGGAVFFALEPEKAVIADYNFELMNFYRWVRDDYERLYHAVKKYKNTPEDYMKVRESDIYVKEGDIDLEKAAKFYYLNKHSFNGLWRVNKKGKYNTPYGKRAKVNIPSADLIEASELLKNATILSQSFEECLDYVEESDFVYFDPPYIPLTQTSFVSYDKDGFDMSHQETLLDVCNKLHKRGASWMLSNSSAPVVYEMYKKYNIKEVLMPRMINSNGKGRGKVKEVLITNY